jgi:hypothetical protein
MNIQTNKVILSAHKNLSTQDDNKRHDRLLVILDDLGYNGHIVTGNYNGTMERSILIVLNDFYTDMQVLKDIAFKTFNQESILYIDTSNNTSLIFSNDTEIMVGKFIQVDNVSNIDNYSIINDKYFTTIN